ncbi:MAG: tyrosine-type recombinase/integrase [Tenericutes bacterium]|nr:tyrosine-type recombinase/integrase [Mycoplasmatota bacterium]
MIKTHPLENLIDQYLAEKDISLGTKEVYMTILNQYLSYLKEHHMFYATTQNVISFRAYSRNRGCSTRWIYHQITVLKGLYQYLSLNQVRLDLPEPYAYNIMKPIKNEQIEKRTTKPILTPEQAKQLLLSLKNHRRCSWHFRDYAMIYLMITTGLRSIEVRRAKIKDLKIIHGKKILYVQGKGRSSKDEFVKISKGVAEAIKDYLNIRKDQSPYLFASRAKRSKKPLTRTIFIGIFKRALKDAGLNDIHMTAHCLRHTAATLNLKRGGTLKETKRLLRHQSMSNTLIYTHHIDNIKDETVSDLENFIFNQEKNE